ncbi:MAG: hypothetical protein WDW38_005099 [Sanguina aurantia]
MDGTLTQAHIPFDIMRSRTAIPVGDLFTVMESCWTGPTSEQQIKDAMTVILEMEATAALEVSGKEGLLELLQLIKDLKVPLALVTRNTTHSVDAFFRLVGEEWRAVFSQVLTREFKYVKPDRRLLQHVAQEWGMEPSRLLMIGDSFEDVECGNSAGTASCLIAGGGNEKPGSGVTAPAGAIPTFAVQSLPELARRLREAGATGSSPAHSGAHHSDGGGPSSSSSAAGTGTAAGTAAAAATAEGHGLSMGWMAKLAAGQPLPAAGAPPPGLQFYDWLLAAGALSVAECSFPRMGRAAGGLATCQTPARTHQAPARRALLAGSRVAHLGCGPAALSKLLASQGMQVVGVDSDVSAARKRGLSAEPFRGAPFSLGSLQGLSHHNPFDTVLIYGKEMPDDQQLAWWSPDSLRETRSVLPATGGWLAAQVPLPSGVNPATVLQSLRDSGWALKDSWVGNVAEFGGEAQSEQLYLRVAAWSIQQ